MTVNLLLVNNFPNIFNVEFTANMEDELDEIESHKSSYLDTVSGFYDQFKGTLDEVNDKIQQIKESLQKASDVDCETCGKPMVIRWGRNGQFLACSGFPDCKTTKPLEEQAPTQETDEVCEKCSSKMVIKRGRYGEFMACSRYPECKNTKPIPTGVACPEDSCDGQIVQRQSRKGKIFYSCSEYPKCKFAIWNRPVAQACPQCSYPILEEKTNRNDGFFLYCSQCKYKEVKENVA